MSMPMNNVNQGGYVPPGYAPNAAPGNYNPSAPPPGNYGFVPGQQPQGYAPVPQMPYGEVPFGGGAQPPYAKPPAYGGAPPPQQMPYGGGPPQQYNGGGGFQPGYDAPNAPIVTQPGQPMPSGQPMGPPGDWMSIPPGIPNCPRGLEYLTSIDQLLVKQKVELLEAFTGFETNNKFSIKNALGQKVYYAVEDNDCCTRNMCGPARPFDMKIFDNFRNEVIHVHRPLACSSCLFPCCLQSMEVSAPPGNVVGTIEQEWSLCAPAFRIKNHIGDTVLRIEGPFCTFSMCGDVEFNILSLTGENIGKISKQWSGLAREIFTDADFFGITFPLDLDVRMKAVLLGATFLIDAMFFEKSANIESDRPGML
ncbi:phospholipid scramblase 2-like isoform X1 [Lucilia sericata]|uniref:phospholipid scramblase 2-like isoform X1 n=1 Tax=Lucilia sericata TaxID=13632 RepID=UPI0018A86FDA|nr:phospholipid scramblase 2-like isoform X1 [Lucilia sericata]